MSNNPWDAQGPLAIMNSSNTSFFSEKQAATENMSKAQLDQLKKHTSKPFMVKKSSRDITAKNQEVDDFLSEISTPEINWDERKKVMDALAQIDKDREEIQMDQTFKDLLGKVQGVEKEEIEDMASRSMTEFRQSGKVNIYKPTLRTGNTPRMQTKEDGQRKPMKVVAQHGLLHQTKDEPRVKEVYPPKAKK